MGVQRMKSKFKKLVVFLMVFIMILGTGIGSYAQGLAAETPELVKPPLEGEDIVQVPVVTDPTEVSYEIQYLILDTEEEVPGLELLEGIGEVGEIIDIPYPGVEGYDVADG